MTDQWLALKYFFDAALHPFRTGQLQRFDRTVAARWREAQRHMTRDERASVSSA